MFYIAVMHHVHQCDFRFYFLVLVLVLTLYFLSDQNINPADEDVLITCLNTVHC